MEFLIVLAVLAVVVFVITGPLRRPQPAAGAAAHSTPGTDDAESREVAELEAVREAKYREIRDAELDLRTGKLSQADYDAIDQTLRAEAVEILHELDRARGVAPQPPAG